MSSDFAAKLAALRAQVPTAPAPAPTPTPQASGGASTTDDGAKAELRRLDLLPIYRSWFHPIAERPGTGDEVNLSCFNTTFHGRGDRNPQFGINTRKQTYYCHACNVSGDIVDLAAVHYGFADANYRCPDDQVHVAVKEAGTELLGMQFSMTPAGWQRVPQFTALTMAGVQAPQAAQPPVPPVPAPSPASRGADGATAPTGMVFGTLNVGAVPGPGDDQTNLLPADLAELLPAPVLNPDDEVLGAGIPLDWRSIVPEGTLMRQYLETVTTDDSPEEYHFWQILTLVGLLCGKDVGLLDAEIVYGNLLVCIVGQTGVGKSRSDRHIERLIDAAVPFNDKIAASTGIMKISGAGSGEYMMKEFHHAIPDPAVNPQKPSDKVPLLVHPGVRGRVKWSELSEMIGKAAATGATVREKIMELYDAAGDVTFGSVTAGKTHVKNPFGSVVTTTQPESIKRLLSRDQIQSGFLNRWVFASGVPKPVIERGILIDVTPVKPAVLQVQQWAQGRRQHARGLLDLTPDGDVELRRFIREEIVPLKRADPLYGRNDLLFKKLCLLLAANAMEFAVSLDTVLRAEKVFGYVVRCQELFGAAMSHSESSEIQDAVLEKIKENFAKTGEGMAGHAIVKALRRKYNGDDVKKVLRDLESLGRLEQLSPNRSGPGRRPKLYYITED
ncbi:DNA primase [Rhodococcus phage Reynauld]|uniref:DNA primase n=1 Tax=Rhodococcus phage Reynauld TaxID=3062845 RepID=A0ACD4UKR6_9CAUD|nr:DNA primase [Rhodococcus phage Reynauld]